MVCCGCVACAIPARQHGGDDFPYFVAGRQYIKVAANIMTTRVVTSYIGTPAAEPHFVRVRRELGCPRAYMSWSVEEDELLMQLLEDGLRPAEVALHLARTPGAVRSRIRHHANGDISD